MKLADLPVRVVRPLGRWQEKEVCRRGHAMTPDNVYMVRDHRHCRACFLERQRGYYRARKCKPAD
jgi:hypothetical protein